MASGVEVKDGTLTVDLSAYDAGKHSWLMDKKAPVPPPAVQRRAAMALKVWTTGDTAKRGIAQMIAAGESLDGGTLRAMVASLSAQTEQAKKGFQDRGAAWQEWVGLGGIAGLNWAKSKLASIQKGGPGSGNFGHEGRPGEVGGSGPGGATHEDEGIYATYAKAEITKAGFHAISFREIPRNLRNQLPGADVGGVRDPVFGADSPQMVAGIVDALNHIPGPPEFADEAKANLKIAFASFHSGIAAATAVGPQGAFIVINTNNEHSDVPPRWTIANQQAGKGTSELYKFVTYHELGHVLDGVSGDSVTLHMVNSLRESGVMAKDMSNDAGKLMSWLKSNISEYAAKGGPKEAAAEVVAMTYGGLEVPKELSKTRDFILGKDHPVPGSGVYR